MFGFTALCFYSQHTWIQAMHVYENRVSSVDICNAQQSTINWWVWHNEQFCLFVSWFVNMDILVSRAYEFMNTWTPNWYEVISFHWNKNPFSRFCSSVIDTKITFWFCPRRIRFEQNFSNRNSTVSRSFPKAKPDFSSYEQ